MGFTLGSVLPNEVRCLVQKKQTPLVEYWTSSFQGYGGIWKLVMILVIFLVYPDVDEHFIILTSFWSLESLSFVQDVTVFQCQGVFAHRAVPTAGARIDARRTSFWASSRQLEPTLGPHPWLFSAVSFHVLQLFIRIHSIIGGSGHLGGGWLNPHEMRLDSDLSNWTSGGACHGQHPGTKNRHPTNLLLNVDVSPSRNVGNDNGEGAPDHNIFFLILLWVPYLEAHPSDIILPRNEWDNNP